MRSLVSKERSGNRLCASTRMLSLRPHSDSGFNWECRAHHSVRRHESEAVTVVGADNRIGRATAAHSRGPIRVSTIKLNSEKIRSPTPAVWQRSGKAVLAEKADGTVYSPISGREGGAPAFPRNFESSLNIVSCDLWCGGGDRPNVALPMGSRNQLSPIRQKG
jgi:hypothetical protein